MIEAWDTSGVGRIRGDDAVITMAHAGLPMPENCGMFGRPPPKPLLPSHNPNPNAMISHCVYTSKRL
jgi:hypothetical protein